MSITVLNVGQNHYINGGSDRYLFSMGALLEKNGHRIIPFASAQPRNLPSQWEDYFPRSVNFQNPKPSDILNFVYSVSAAKAISHLIKSATPDLAHLHIYYGQLTSSILNPLKSAGIPIVQTLHEFKTVCPTYSLFSNGKICEACEGHKFWRAVTQRCNRGSFLRSALSATEAYVARWVGAIDKVDHFIAVSDFLRDKVISLGLPGNKITTIHNFIDCTYIAPADQPGDYLLYFGRLERIKGIYTLLEAITPLVNIPILIVGDGNEMIALQYEIKQRGLDHVKLLGFKQGVELENLIRGCICTIAPSEWYETFGLTLVESFAHGRPVVASQIGGMTEVVDDGIDGFLVPPGDVIALRERLAWMATHPTEALEMGRRGRIKVEKKFSPTRHYEQLMRVYRGVGVG